MRSLKIALLATVAAAAFTSATLAADPIIMIDEPMYVQPASSSWDGPYVGLFVLGQTTDGFGVGVNAGVNFSTDGLLFGVEGDVAYLAGTNAWQGQVVGKLGAALADEAVIYGLAGIGSHSVDGAYVPVGIGAEVMVADSISLKGQYEYHWDLGGVGTSDHVGKVGLNFHF
jgi:opacity protein-like surface antigen